MNLDIMEDGDVELIEADIRVFKAIKKYSLMDLGEYSMLKIRDRLSLAPFFGFFENFNGGNLLPYHNAYHACCMVNNCYEGAYHERLSLDETTAVVIAALFHDFNHSGGHSDDEFNIVKAVRGLDSAQAYAASFGLGLKPEVLASATAAIKVTQFPFIFEPETSVQRIIRDADLMQAYETNDVLLYKQYRGLIDELEVGLKKKLTDVEFGDGNRKFLDEVRWYTIWAKEKAIIRDWEEIKRRQQEMFTRFRH